MCSAPNVYMFVYMLIGTHMVPLTETHLPSLKCPKTTKMQPKRNAVRHVVRWVTFVAHHSLYLCTHCDSTIN